MKNMKISKADMEEKSEPQSVDSPQYPYGLKIYLDNDMLEKLGISQLPQVGASLVLSAKCEVCEVGQYDSKDGGKNQTMSIQITDMALEAPAAKESAEKVLYGA